MRKYSFTTKKTIMRNPMRFETMHLIRVYDEGESESSIFNYDNKCDTIEQYLNNEINQNILNIEVVGLNNEELSAILLANKNTIQTLNVISQYISDLSALSDCKAIKSVKLASQATSLTLFNTAENNNLQSLWLELPNCEILNNLQGLKNSTLSTFKLLGYQRKVPDLTLFSLNDISWLLTLKNLKDLSLHCPFDMDKLNLIKTLAKLTNLEELNLPKTCFTFKEFAWLSSKLEGVKGLDAFLTYYKDHRRDIHMFVILGSDMVDVEDERPYVEEYNYLKEEYKSLDNPPIGE